MCGICVMIPGFRARQPRDGPMNCGNQSAHISMIHRRFKPSRRVTLALSILQTFSIEAQKAVKFMRTPLTTVRPYQLAIILLGKTKRGPW